MIMDAVRSEWNMDARRIYVFGVSAGGYTVFDVCMFDSQYLAAGAVFADVITPDFDWIVHKATPKIPIAIYTGIATSSSPLPGAENTPICLPGTDFPSD